MTTPSLKAAEEYAANVCSANGITICYDPTQYEAFLAGAAWAIEQAAGIAGSIGQEHGATHSRNVWQTGQTLAQAIRRLSEPEEK